MKGSNRINNADFYEAKSRLGLLSVGDPGANDKIQVNDTFLISVARKIDLKIKSHPKLKTSLIRGRNQARKLKSFAGRIKSSLRTKPVNSAVPAQAIDVQSTIKDIAFTKQAKPQVSIVIPAFNKVEYSVACLRSIADKLAPDSPTYEVILVDNGSSDETRLLKGVKNLVYVHNKENLGFVGGCNSGFAKAKGEYVVFLNNDAEVTENWLKALYSTINSDTSIGIVGSKIIYPSGVLQEAGGIIFNDATGLNYGKFDQANSYQYNYVRSVDYCSGASVIISRALMQKFGGFDPLYQPAYYEDTDLSFKVRKHGLRAVYQPDSVIYHIEGGTAGTNTNSGFKRYQVINQEKFLKRWKNELRDNHVAPGDHYRGRDRSGDKLALIIEESLPTPDKDSGSVRMVAMIKSLQSLGYKITFWPNSLNKIEPYAHNLQQMGVEVVYGNVDFMQFSRHYGSFYDLVIMSRPEICARYVGICKNLYPKAKLIYDTVDLHYVRLKRQAEVEKENAEQLNEQSRWYEILEKGLMERVDATLVVSEKEIDILRDEGVRQRLAIVSNIHTLNLPAQKIGYSDRKDIIFVGNYAHLPNRDSVRWLVDDIFPTIRKHNPEVKLHIVGANMPDEIRSHVTKKNVVVDGFVTDEGLVSLLTSCRIFVAPLRYGAGVKGKIGQSIEWGLPVVTTSIGAEGMYLENGLSCLEADTAEGFAQAVAKLYRDKGLWETVQKNAANSLEAHFSSSVATKNIEDLLQKLE